MSDTYATKTQSINEIAEKIVSIRKKWLFVILRGLKIII